MSVQLVPSCTNCFALKTKDNSLKRLDGINTKTTEKLSACSKCHFDRYCSIDCQRKHLSAHKSHCISGPRIMKESEIDSLIQKHCDKQAGSVALWIESGKVTVFFKEPKREIKEYKLSVDVKVDGKDLGNYDYILCLKSAQLTDYKFEDFTRFTVLANEMIAKGSYIGGFKVIAENLPPVVKKIIEARFFADAIKCMHKKNVKLEEMVNCAAILGKNKEEVEAVINSPKKAELPEELSKEIKVAEKLPYGSRDVKMVEFGKKIIQLGLYDEAFDLIYSWVAIKSAQIKFFEHAISKMIPEKISYEKIVQLGRKISLSEDEILNNCIGIYAIKDFDKACKLAGQSSKSDYYYEIIFSALLNNQKYDLAKQVLSLVSKEKASDLSFYLRGK